MRLQCLRQAGKWIKVERFKQRPKLYNGSCIFSGNTLSVSYKYYYDWEFGVMVALTLGGEE